MGQKDCPVAAMGMEAASITRLINELQSAQFERRDCDRSFLEHREKHMASRLEAIEAMAAHRVSTSADGVLFQVMLLGSLADVIASYIDESEQPELNRDIARIASLTWAAMHGLEGMGADRDRVGGEYYAPRALDPLEQDKAA